MLVVGCLRRHAITWLWLAVHALLAGTPRKGCSIAALAASVSELAILGKKLVIETTGVVVHGPIAPECMVTYLVRICLIVRAMKVWMAIRISPMLSPTLPLRLLLLLWEQLRRLTRLPLAMQRWIWGGTTTALRIAGLAVPTRRLLLRLAGRMLSSLLGG